MILEQFYLGCLSQASYFIGDETSGRAIVVDPRRDVEEYIERAERDGLRIELVVLTHVHADFIPGHTELAALTGAEIGMGEHSPVDFPIRRLRDGERISLGDVAIEVLATPGHTPESITLAVYEHGDDAAPTALLTGDTLFLGDVGRPDLLGAAGRTAEDMAADLYRSLRTKILPLPDDVLVYPGHGAGSACGKALSNATVSTLGEQRRTNYALAPMSVDQFVAAVTDGLGAPPAYFEHDVAVNRAGHEAFDPDADVPRIDAAGAVRLAAAGHLLLDIRDDQAFTAAHLRHAVNVGLTGRFAEYAAAVRPPGQQVILFGTTEQCYEARIRLARVGVDDVDAEVDDILELDRHPELVETSSRLTVAQAATLIADTPDLQVVDVRSKGEHAGGALPGAINLCVTGLLNNLDTLDPTRPVLVHCASGYRSILAASLLSARGFTDVSDLLGGYNAWAGATEKSS